MSPKSTSTGAPEAGPQVVRALQGTARAELWKVLELSTRPGVIAFGIGTPAADLFPGEGLDQASHRLGSQFRKTMQYGIPCAPLKRQLVELMARRGVTCREEQIFLTTGAQQAMSLLSHLFLEHGGSVMLEDIVYEGIHNAIKSLAPVVETVPTHGDRGIDLDAVEERLEAGSRPAFLYLIPAGHNPLGVTLDLDQRRRLVELSRRFGIPLLEDDAYGFLHHRDETLPALRSFDDQWVFYMGTLSKVMAPALRIGWMVIPEEMVPTVSYLKHGNDVDSSTYAQYLVADYLENVELDDRLRAVRTTYQQRRDTTLAALERHMPPGIRWNRPESGMYLWLELPESIDTMELLTTAVETEKVAFSPGCAFVAPGQDGRSRHRAHHCLRLCFANFEAAEIEEGIARLGRVCERAVGAVVTPS